MSSVAPPAEMASPRSEAAIFPIPRVAIKGKFFYRGEEKLYLRGVTYGTFTPDSQGDQYGSEETVDADFARMAGAGINCVRVYTVPPLWLLDLAARHQLLVMVGLLWEQHVDFVDLLGGAAKSTRGVGWGSAPAAGTPLCWALRSEMKSRLRSCDGWAENGWKDSSGSSTGQ